MKKDENAVKEFIMAVFYTSGIIFFYVTGNAITKIALVLEALK